MQKKKAKCYNSLDTNFIFLLFQIYIWIFLGHENKYVIYFMAQFEIFSTANPPKTSQNIILCAIKMAHRMTSI